MNPDIPADGDHSSETEPGSGDISFEQEIDNWLNTEWVDATNSGAKDGKWVEDEASQWDDDTDDADDGDNDDDDDADDDDDGDESFGYSDPGCEHSWKHLVFFGDNPDLLCARCGREWDVTDEPGQALNAVWNSARLGFESAQIRHDRLAAVVETMTGMVRCHVCERWSSPEEIVTLSTGRACPEHLGLLLDADSSIGDEIHEVTDWLQQRIKRDADLYSVWLLMRAATDCDELDDEVDVGRDWMEQTTVTLSTEVSRALELSRLVTVWEAVERFSEQLELPTPNTTAARVVLLGVLARAEWAYRNLGAVTEEVLAEVSSEAVPAHGMIRALAVIDLYRDDLPNDGILTVDAINDLVSALVSRAASRLLSTHPS